MLKKLLLCTFALALILIVVRNYSNNLEEPTTTALNTNNARIAFTTQEYTGNNIAEIPYIKYDGKVNPEIEAINLSLKQGIQQKYNSFIGSVDKQKWIEIRSYPFTSKDYLQVVVTDCAYPTDGTDGNMFSINYDRKSGKALTVNDIMMELNIEQNHLKEDVIRLFQPETPGQSISEVSVTGFLINEGTNGRHVKLLLEIMVKNSKSELWRSFYSYAPELDELYRMNSTCLFDPQDMDHMEPPLSYESLEDYIINEGSSKPLKNLTISKNDNYNLTVDYFSNTYIKEDYSDGGTVLGYVTVDKADTFYDTVFDYFNNKKIKPAGISFDKIPSGLSQFKLINNDFEKPSYQVSFDDAAYSVYFLELVRHDNAVYVAQFDEEAYYSLKELIGEIRLGAKNFEMIQDLNVYELLNVPMLYSSLPIIIGNHYTYVDKSLNPMNVNKEKTNKLLSLITVSDRNTEFPAKLGKHMAIIDENNSTIGWVYFDTGNSKMYIYPASKDINMTLCGAYSITQDTLQYAVELLDYLKTMR